MCFRLLIVFEVPVIIRQIVVSVQWPYSSGAGISNPVNDHVNGEDVNDFKTEERIQREVRGRLDWVASYPRLWGCLSLKNPRSANENF